MVVKKGGGWWPLLIFAPLDDSVLFGTALKEIPFSQKFVAIVGRQ